MLDEVTNNLIGNLHFQKEVNVTNNTPSYKWPTGIENVKTLQVTLTRDKSNKANPIEVQNTEIKICSGEEESK